MTEDQQLEFIERLKTEPESAQGVMELTLDILVYQHGSKLAKDLVLRALTNAIKGARLRADAVLEQEQQGRELLTPTLLNLSLPSFTTRVSTKSKSPNRFSPREFTSNIYGNFSNPVRCSMSAVERARG